MVSKKYKVTATMEANGDLLWSHGFVTKLWNACRDPECDASFSDLIGDVRTWKTSDRSMKPIEKARFAPKAGK